MNSKVIVALDFPDIKSMRDLVEKLDPALCRVKVGNILFTHYGPSLIEELMTQGFDVFLDLKYHDIPQTVAGACRSAAELGVWMTNLHVFGGEVMMAAAREELDRWNGSAKPLLIAVTVLTSMEEGDIAALGMKDCIQDLVPRFASLAQKAGLDGVVCSSQEAAVLRSELGSDFILVTPGIRLTKERTDDQKRIMTPREAIDAGSDYLVIGRPITRAEDPIQVLENIVNSINVV
jgi:orotidine-5'-phosphate decarboxylase